MKKLLVIGFILLALTGCGKEIDISQKQIRNGIVYTVNANEPYTGKVVGKYKNGKEKLLENFKNGKFNGTQTYYYDNGQIKEKISYKNGIAVGTYYEYHQNGEVAYTGQFSNGKKNGEWNRYTDENKLVLTETYKDGKLENLKQFIVDTDKIKGKIDSLFN